MEEVAGNRLACAILFQAGTPIFDSKLNTYVNLNARNEKKIDFITLRRGSDKILRELQQEPASAWRRIELEAVIRVPTGHRAS